MKIKLCVIICAFSLLNCSSKDSSEVTISTEYGDIVIKLYDKTPEHRANFIKLVKDGYYDGTLFHRVIKDFMIQGGDPDSKKAQPGAALGTGGPGYTVPAEFVPEYIHKKGALAAARQGDDINPEKRSSGSQFYLVQGKTYTDEELNQMEIAIAQNNAMQKYAEFIQEEEKAMKDAGKEVDPYEAQMKAQAKTSEYYQSHPYKMDANARQTYKTIGGTPFLDGSYTVFGEVVKGLEVIDVIAKVQTDGRDRPMKDIKITIK